MRNNVGRASANGGFPLPPENEPVRLVASHHDACSGNTRVRLPKPLPARAVRRVVCDRCGQPYAPATVKEVRERRLSVPSLPVPSLPEPSWRWAGLPVAAAAVVVGLTLIQDDDEPQTTAPSVAPAESESAAQGPDGGGGPAGGNQAPVPDDARLVRESTFQVALPPGWQEIEPSGGATFAAVADEGDADGMLWVERDPKLDFASFEARSLDQLESLAGSAATVDRTVGPTCETTSMRLAPTSAPPGAPNYEVLLRCGAGDLWYYLATTSQPGASPEALEGVKLIQGSFTPIGGK
jgi:hypothetical protein